MSTWRAGQESAKTAESSSDNHIFAELAAKYNVTEAQFLLGWGIQNGFAVLPKSLNPERMFENTISGSRPAQTSRLLRVVLT